jgi:hypothetical protein
MTAMARVNYRKRFVVLFLACFFEFGREYFTPLRRFAEEREISYDAVYETTRIARLRHLANVPGE